MAGTAASRRRSRGISREPLTQAQVVDGALAIIDEGGMDALSMRALASRLDAFPTSLYWHAGNKAALLALVSQRVLSEMRLADPATVSWSEWIVSMGREARRVFADHPHFAGYFNAHIQASSPSLQLAEQTLTVLAGAGFAGEHLLRAYNVVLGTVFGWIGGEFAAAPADADADWQKRFSAELAPGDVRHPTVTGNFDTLVNRAFLLRWEPSLSDQMAESFEFLLTTLVAGLTAQLAGLPIDRR